MIVKVAERLKSVRPRPMPVVEMERKKILNEAQFLSVEGCQDDFLYLNDTRKRQFIEIQLSDKKIWCLTDNSYDCIHIKYATVLPEVKQALLC